MEYLLNIDINKVPAPMVGKFLYSLVARNLGVIDPYYELKKEYNQLALDYYDEVKDIINKAKDPLFEAIIVAAIGNTVDFASQHQINLINDIKCFSTNDLKINDYEDFKTALKKTNQLLILLDNVGEIVFDKLLVITLQEKYPNLEIVCAVRSAPIINDATIDDAKLIGLTEIAKVIESCPIPGIDLESATEEFKYYFFNKEGIILSKGQGNFECLYGMDTGDKPIFYLLKAKCTLMERMFNVKIGDLIFKKKTVNF
jgi:uncharacterized protein with ATP-grasp and redox domains